ncbi:MAG: DsbA family protein [Rhodospirillales bacterium]|nr:DsbA family protein [Rhodospirillales bacterium]MDP6642665.1 DsbA family protein [Rhodospirillales bacterium]
MTTFTKELIYVGDPQCSWCWGFTPVKKQIEDMCRGRAALTLVVGGLHADWTEPAKPEYKTFLRDHWQEVAQRTGQPFIYDILDADGLSYGTEASCRAAVTVRRMQGNEAALKFFTQLQRAYYAENRNLMSGEVLADMAAEFGLDRDAFTAEFAAPETQRRTVADFQFAQRLGVSGFPTVLINDEAGYAYLTVGYQPFEQLGHIVEAWLDNKLDRGQAAAQ